jgi:uncharacterized membrane protein YwaF
MFCWEYGSRGGSGVICTCLVLLYFGLCCVLVGRFMGRSYEATVHMRQMEFIFYVVLLCRIGCAR